MAVTDPIPMLLTLPSPKRGFDFKTPHDFAGHRTSSSTSAPQQLSSPPPERSASLYLPRKSPVEGSGTGNSKSQMSGTPQHSRNLPPPPPLSLPDPRGLQPPGPPSVPQSIQSVLGSLPPPPGQWQGHEDSMRSWLLTKSEEERRRQEEERRKQEEERSRQEHYRLEQRKIEQSMLQESLRAGVPPAWMPMLFIAISGSTTLAGSEVFQNYLSQIMSQQPQIQPGTSPESSRSVPHPSQQQSYGQQPPQSTPQTPLGQQQPYPQFPGSASTAQIRGSVAGPSGPGRGQSFEMLPRLATGHAGVPSGPAGHAPSSQPQEVASPIYFHHWTPPTSQTGASGTAGGNSNNPAPATPSDFNNSPKKRKTTTSHPSVPPPSSRFSTDTGGRRTGHSRQRSDLSMRGLSTTEPNTRPSSSAADSATIPEGQQMPQPQVQPHQWIQQHPSSSSTTTTTVTAQQQQQQQQQTSQLATAPRPGADGLKAEEHPAGDGGAERGGFGSRRSSQPHSSGRASEDVEMSER